MAVLNFNDSGFSDEVLNSELPVLVDFWAPWCAPCIMIAPVIEQLAQEYDNQIKIGKLNVDENPQTASQYGIMSIPTLVFFKDGKAIDQVLGVVTKSQLKAKIEENLR